MNKLKKYVCKVPFDMMDVQANSQWLCCPSWLKTNVRVHADKTRALVYDENHKVIGYTKVNFDESLKDSWFSEAAQDARTSIYNGEYSYCDRVVCPSLSTLINTDTVPIEFMDKEDFKNQYNVKNIDDVKNYNKLPERILFGFDRSCNLECPSCRPGLVSNDDPDSYEHKVKEFILKNIETEFAENLKCIVISGSGEPFYSKIFRDYLINFRKELYPNLETIQLTTNCVLLTEDTWTKMKAKDYIRMIDVSIDAGTQHTYENVTRLNGKWDKLLTNLKFLSTVNTIYDFHLSMVVSELNYKEMFAFYELMVDIFKDSTANVVIKFHRHVFWPQGKYDLLQLKQISVFDTNHPKHNDFISEVKKISNLPMVRHNFHELLS